MHALVAKHAIEQREKAIAVVQVRKQQGQRLDRLVRFIASNDFLLAADTSHLVERKVREQVVVFFE